MENLVYIVNGSDKTVNTCISFYNRLKIYEDGTIIYKDKIIEKDEYIYQALLDICGTYTVTNERQKVALNIRKMCINSLNLLVWSVENVERFIILLI
jgi:hypothetical protein